MPVRFRYLERLRKGQVCVAAPVGLALQCSERSLAGNAPLVADEGKVREVAVAIGSVLAGCAMPFVHGADLVGDRVQVELGPVGGPFEVDGRLERAHFNRPGERAADDEVDLDSHHLGGTEVYLEVLGSATPALCGIGVLAGA
ncbi:hypothetical protein ACFWPP_34480 [Streptomyces anulatus]|uniref:hypothetical protein n=1 Tax=Streptomyces anulatus TaxID=1892 RepID=UPI00364FC2EC